MDVLAREHQISVVIPVYQSEKTLAGVLDELERWTRPFTTPDGHQAVVSEVVLVHDCGPDASDRVIREAARTYEWVRPIWLSRNFGQHAATLAGMSSSGIRKSCSRASLTRYGSPPASVTPPRYA